jgi:hypothetical protein
LIGGLSAANANPRKARFSRGRIDIVAMSEAQIAVIGKARERLETLKVRL